MHILKREIFFAEKGLWSECWDKRNENYNRMWKHFPSTISISLSGFQPLVISYLMIYIIRIYLFFERQREKTEIFYPLFYYANCPFWTRWKLLARNSIRVSHLSCSFSLRYMAIIYYFSKSIIWMLFLQWCNINLNLHSDIGFVSGNLATVVQCWYLHFESLWVFPSLSPYL